MNTTALSTDYWHSYIFSKQRGNETIRLMLDALRRELPQMCSVTMERACNLQCAHCEYPYEKSSEALSRAAKLPELVLRAAEQLSGDAPRLLHEGRIIKPWHIEILGRARRIHKKLRIGLIDNGTYVRWLTQFMDQGLRLDWLDLSLDGPEHAHNLQRGSEAAYRDAMQGFERARVVTRSRREGGRVSALFTLTNLNHTSLSETADILFARNDPLADQLHVTTMSPARKELEPLEQFDMKAFWHQARSIVDRYGHDTEGAQRIFFRIYRHQEIAKFAEIVGKKIVLRAFMENVRFASGEVYLTIQGVPLVYSPISLWPGETFLIDADGSFRMAYSISRTLTDLRRGRTRNGEDLRGFTIEQLKPDFDLKSLHERCVDQWWSFRGKRYLQEERVLFDQLRSR